MAATKAELQLWFDRGMAKNEEYMIIVCDTFDMEDYPVFCSSDKFKEQYEGFSAANMQKVMEVYDLSMDREKQMAEFRAYHYPPTFIS